MVASVEREDLRAVVREHHVHFDVEHEVVLRGRERVQVGYEVRLWAVHPKGSRALPGCRKCLDLARALEQLAGAVLPESRADTRFRIEPFRRALYESSIVAGADEICLPIRIIHADGYARPVDECQQRCLKDLKRALKEVGVVER